MIPDERNVINGKFEKCTFRGKSNIPVKGSKIYLSNDTNNIPHLCTTRQSEWNGSNCFRYVPGKCSIPLAVFASQYLTAPEEWFGYPLTKGEYTNFNYSYGQYPRIDSKYYVDGRSSSIGNLEGIPLVQRGTTFNGGKYGWNHNNGYQGRIRTNDLLGNQLKDKITTNVIRNDYGGNSDNCLPRIIKPRKRRKKDRKPIAFTQQCNEAQKSTDNTNVEDNTKCNNDDNDNNTVNEVSENPQDITSRALLNLLLEDDTTVDFDKLYDSTDNLETGQPFISCNCRYCDPGGLIWDIHPNLQNSRNNSKMDMNESSELRRSWSSESYRPVVNEVSGHSSSDSSSETSSLQVSSEIITTPDGHRDIEIKFYTSPPTSSASVFNTFLNYTNTDFSDSNSNNVY